MNSFFKFFAAIFASITGLFSASKGYERKVNEHNAHAYEKLQRKLRPFAERFLLPVCKRDKDGCLIKNKKVKKYEKFLKERKIELLGRRGHEYYEIEGQYIQALNYKNAKRKWRQSYKNAELLA